MKHQRMIDNMSHHVHLSASHNDQHTEQFHNLLAIMHSSWVVFLLNTLLHSASFRASMKMCRQILKVIILYHRLGQHSHYGK